MDGQGRKEIKEALGGKGESIWEEQVEGKQKDQRGESLEPPDRAGVEHYPAHLRRGDKSWSDYGCCCQLKNMLQ